MTTPRSLIPPTPVSGSNPPHGLSPHPGSLSRPVGRGIGGTSFRELLRADGPPIEGAPRPRGAVGKEGSEPLVAEPRADETTAGTATGRTALSPRHQGEGDDESASDEREAPANLGAVVDPEAAESFALSPLGRSLATAPPMAPAPCLPNSAVVAVATLMTRLARRIALGRERGAASLRVEIGEGTLSGAVLVVESRSGGLRIELELPPGTNGVEWKEKLSARLAERGLASAALSVH